MRNTMKSLGNRRDWPFVASVMGRDAADCEARWKQVLHPRISKGPWTPEVRGAGWGGVRWGRGGERVGERWIRSLTLGVEGLLVWAPRAPGVGSSHRHAPRLLARTHSTHPQPTPPIPRPHLRRTPK